MKSGSKLTDSELYQRAEALYKQALLIRIGMAECLPRLQVLRAIAERLNSHNATYLENLTRVLPGSWKDQTTGFNASYKNLQAMIDLYKKNQIDLDNLRTNYQNFENAFEKFKTTVNEAQRDAFLFSVMFAGNLSMISTIEAELGAEGGDPEFAKLKAQLNSSVDFDAELETARSRESKAAIKASFSPRVAEDKTDTKTIATAALTATTSTATTSLATTTGDDIKAKRIAELNARTKDMKQWWNRANFSVELLSFICDSALRTPRKFKIISGLLEDMRTRLPVDEVAQALEKCKSDLANIKLWHENVTTLHTATKYDNTKRLALLAKHLQLMEADRELQSEKSTPSEQYIHYKGEHDLLSSPYFYEDTDRHIELTKPYTDAQKKALETQLKELIEEYDSRVIIANFVKQMDIFLEQHEKKAATKTREIAMTDHIAFLETSHDVLIPLVAKLKDTEKNLFYEPHHARIPGLDFQFLLSNILHLPKLKNIRSDVPRAKEFLDTLVDELDAAFIGDSKQSVFSPFVQYPNFQSLLIRSIFIGWLGMTKDRKSLLKQIKDFQNDYKEFLFDNSDMETKFNRALMSYGAVTEDIGSPRDSVSVGGVSDEVSPRDNLAVKDVLDTPEEHRRIIEELQSVLLPNERFSASLLQALKALDAKKTPVEPVSSGTAFAPVQAVSSPTISIPKPTSSGGASLSSIDIKTTPTSSLSAAVPESGFAVVTPKQVQDTKELSVKMSADTLQKANVISNLLRNELGLKSNIAIVVDIIKNKFQIILDQLQAAVATTATSPDSSPKNTKIFELSIKEAIDYVSSCVPEPSHSMALQSKEDWQRETEGLQRAQAQNKLIMRDLLVSAVNDILKPYANDQGYKEIKVIFDGSQGYVYHKTESNEIKMALPEFHRKIKPDNPLLNRNAISLLFQFDEQVKKLDKNSLASYTYKKQAAKTRNLFDTKKVEGSPITRSPNIVSTATAPSVKSSIITSVGDSTLPSIGGVAKKYFESDDDKRYMKFGTGLRGGGLTVTSSPTKDNKLLPTINKSQTAGVATTSSAATTKSSSTPTGTASVLVSTTARPPKQSTTPTLPKLNTGTTAPSTPQPKRRNSKS